MPEKITKETTLEEIMKLKGGEEVLVRHGVPCVTCPMAQMEMKFLKLGEVCERYGIDAEKIIKEIKKLE